MNYAKLFFITMLTVCTVQPKPQAEYPERIHKTIEAWIHEHFAHKLYEDLTYTEEVFMNLKQHLFDKKQIEDMPHKDLKEIVKDNIKHINQKKYRSRHWFAKHQKEFTVVIKNYFKSHPKNKWGIYNYLNTCSHKVCKNLQETMHRDDILPAVINGLMKKLITQLQS